MRSMLPSLTKASCAAKWKATISTRAQNLPVHLSLRRCVCKQEQVAPLLQWSDQCHEVVQRCVGEGLFHLGERLWDALTRYAWESSIHITQNMLRFMFICHPPFCGLVWRENDKDEGAMLPNLLFWLLIRALKPYSAGRFTNLPFGNEEGWIRDTTPVGIEAALQFPAWTTQQSVLTFLPSPTGKVWPIPEIGRLCFHSSFVGHTLGFFRFDCFVFLTYK